ncbi:MAG: FHA domain-containing protein, partial [Chitinispirillaceae bacterium]|nr:FHA domain-containing protein [Chitinispirillaceae bacterium]
DMSYVHRTTEPHMRAIPEKIVSDSERSGPDAGLHQDKESGGAVLIETNKHVVYKIDKKYLTMGSSEEDDIFVSGFMVSEHQVAIEVQPEGILISSNKLMGKLKINGKPKRQHILQHKDRIEVGSSTFRFMENG